MSSEAKRVDTLPNDALTYINNKITASFPLAKFGDKPSVMHYLTSSSSSASGHVHEALYDLNAKVERYICYRMELNDDDGSSEKQQELLKEALVNCETVLDWSWQRINTGKWSEVPLVARKVFAYHRLLKATLIMARCFHNPNYIDLLIEAVDCIDHGLIMSPDLPLNLLSRIASKLHQNIIRLLDQQLYNLARDQATDQSKACQKWSHILSRVNQSLSYKPIVYIPRLKLPVNRTIPRVSDLNFIDFETDYFIPAVPVIIVGETGAWPCMNKHRWTAEYLVRKAGWRTVPVELGARYTDESWSQKLMPFIDFVDVHILRAGYEPVETGYLAQHSLFEQIPELGMDFEEPDYCAVHSNYRFMEDVEVNAWFGPAGTVSPLHTDPKQNLLTQVKGRKYIRLYSDKTPAEQIFPHTDSLLSNTSAVDLELAESGCVTTNSSKHLAFRQIDASLIYECILEEGEMLYIPKGWWHFVKSLDVSFSISFWWK